MLLCYLCFIYLFFFYLQLVRVSKIMFTLFRLISDNFVKFKISEGENLSFLKKERDSLRNENFF